MRNFIGCIESRFHLMQKLIPVVAIFIVLFASCRQHQQGSESASQPTFQKTFLDVVLDSTATWAQINEAATAFVDSLFIIAADESNGKNRLAAQQWGYMTIELLYETYDEMKEAGKEVNYDDLPPLLERINDAASIWFYTEDEQLPHIWRDHYYVCHQQAENPINGFFHIMVTLPTKERQEPSLEIFYPDAADDVPVLIFSKYLKDGSAEEDYDNQEIIPLSDWSKKDEVQEGFPMHAKAGADVVEKMLDYDVLYLMFRSSISPDGDPAETEIARLSLNPFQCKWTQYNK